MDLSDILEKRLKEKGLTRYKLAQKLAELEGAGKDPTAYSTKVGKVISDPKNRVFHNVEQIVHLLDGEIIVRWTDTRDQAIGD